MNSNVKKLWIDALRSGEYTQTSGLLKRGEAMCCLGVLCDLYKKETGYGVWDEFDNFRIDGAGHLTILPKEVCNWAGISNNDPSIADVDAMSPAIKTLPATVANDRINMTFNEIADCLETGLLPDKAKSYYTKLNGGQ